MMWFVGLLIGLVLVGLVLAVVAQEARKQKPKQEPKPQRTVTEEWEKRYAMYLRIFSGLKQGLFYKTSQAGDVIDDSIGVVGPCVAESILALAVMDVKNNRAARSFTVFQEALVQMLPPAEVQT